MSASTRSAGPSVSVSQPDVESAGTPRFVALQSIMEWAVLAYLLSACIPPILIRHHALTIVGPLNLLDGSWLLDTAYKASGGIWFGRDVAFTYGPLYQWLASASARWLGVSLGVIFATYATVSNIVVVLATFFSSRLLMPRAAPWRRALLVILAAVFWSPPDVRISLVLLAFAWLLRLSGRVADDTANVWLAAASTAAICIAGFLFSADTGVYFVAAFVLCVVVVALIRRSLRVVVFALGATACFAVLALVVHVTMPNFWRSSLAIAQGYRWFEPQPMTKSDKHLVLEILALGVGTFCLGWWRRRREGRLARRPEFLIAAFLLGLLALQTCLVRSDYGHMRIGMYAIVFFCGVVVLERFERQRWLSLALPVAAVVMTLSLENPYAPFTFSGVASEFRQVAHPLEACPQGLELFDHACLQTAAYDLLVRVSDYVNSKAQPHSPIAVFPYETAFGLTSRHQVSGGVLQSYLVNGEYLTQLDLAGLERDQPPLALYLPDGALSVALDGIPDFTRSPELWFYYLQHYRADANPVPGVLGLVREEDRARRLQFETQQIAKPLGEVKIHQRSTRIDLGAVQWPAPGADFVKLRIKIAYPLWWRLRKPSKLMLHLQFADGSQKDSEVLVEPNHLTDVWLYPYDEKGMGGYFSAREAEWPRSNRSAVTGLVVYVNPFDWVSVIPGSVTIEKIEAVRISLR